MAGQIKVHFVLLHTGYIQLRQVILILILLIKTNMQVWHVKTRNGQTCHAQFYNHVFIPVYLLTGTCRERQHVELETFKSMLRIAVLLWWNYSYIACRIAVLKDYIENTVFCHPVSWVNTISFKTTWNNSPFYDAQLAFNRISCWCLHDMCLLFYFQPLSAFALMVTCRGRSCRWETHDFMIQLRPNSNTFMA